MSTLLPLIAGVLLALAHVYGVRVTFSPAIPRSQWLSMAGGSAVAFVFLHILPELSRGQEAVDASSLLILGFLEQHVYIVALIGLMTYYAVEHAVKVSHSGTVETSSVISRRVFWTQMAAFGLYNAIIGYLLLHRYESGVTTLVIFTLAMLLHLMVNDHALRELHQQDYHDFGRWLLAATVLGGWALGLVVDISEAALGLLFAFIAGAIILNVLKEELPRERQSKVWAFVVGATGYSVVLLLLE